MLTNQNVKLTNNQYGRIDAIGIGNKQCFKLNFLENNNNDNNDNNNNNNIKI